MAQEVQAEEAEGLRPVQNDQRDEQSVQRTVEQEVAECQLACP